MASSSRKPQSIVVELDAISTQQDGTQIFVGAANAKALIDVTTVDYYNPSLSPTDPKNGYQRPPERSRITKIGRYLIDGDGGGLMPTAVVLASRTKLQFDVRSGKVSVSSDAPLQIVDGQHRLAGFKYAIEEKGAQELEHYSVPFVIIESADRLTEMKQFRTVNGTAKQVRTDLVNMILTAEYSGVNRADVPKTEHWRIVVANAVDVLAKQAGSPWRDMIGLPGETTTRGEGGKPIRATSFITSLRPVYMWLKESSGILDRECRSTDEEIAYLAAKVSDFWRAVQNVVPKAFADSSEFVVQKTPGVFSMHMLMRHLLGMMYEGRRKFDVATFEEYLNESPEVVDPDFWRSDSRRASVFGSMKGFSELYEILSEPYRK